MAGLSEAADGPAITRGFGRLRTALLFTFSVLATTSVAVWLYHHEKDVLHRNAGATLRAVGQLKVRQLRAWHEERHGDGRAFADRSFLSRAFGDWEAGGRSDAALRERLRRRLDSILESYRYRAVDVHALDGTSAIAVGEPIHDPDIRVPIEAAAARGQTSFVDFRARDTRHGPQVVLDVLTPLTVPNGPRSHKVGVLHLQVDPGARLYPLIETWPGPSDTGETLLVRREGDQVVFLNELRHRENTALRLRRPLTDETLPAAAAVLGRIGTFEGVDYRGEPVVAFTTPVPDTDWKLVTKIDIAEVEAPLRGLMLGLGAGGSLLLIAIGWALVSQRRAAEAERLEGQVRFERDRKAIEHHYARLATHANDIIVLFDLEGRIIEANTRAEAAYGYSRDELRTMNAGDLRAPDARAQFERDLGRWAAKGVVYETIHRHRDGRTFPVEVSGRQIEIGGHRYFQSIVRDISLRWEAQQALVRKARALATLSAANSYLIRALEGKDLLQSVCEVITDQGGYPLTWVGRAEADDRKTISVRAFAGAAGEYARGIEVTWAAEDPRGAGPAGTAIREQRTVINRDVETTASFAPWRARAQSHGLRSSVAIPMRLHGDVAGALCIYGSEVDAFGPEEQALLEQLANNVAFGLRVRDLESERKANTAALASSEMRLQKVIREAPDAILIVGADTRIRFANPAADRLFGREANALLGVELGSVGGTRPDQEIDIVRPDGTQVVADTHQVPIEWEGEPGYLYTIHDITVRKEAERELRRNEARYRALYDENPIIHITIDTDATVLSVNQFGADQLGYAAQQLIGRPITDLFHEGDVELVLGLIRSALEHPEAVHQGELREVRRDGSVRWVRESLRAVEGQSGWQVLVVSQDITEAHELSDQLVIQARHDALTGLLNRREFERRVDSALREAASGKAEHVLCYLDLDQFKVLNNTCGQVAGDQFLCRVSELLQRRLRAGDTLARLGGDDFGVLISNCDMEHAERLAETLIDLIQGFTFAWEEKMFRVGASIGLVPITRESPTAERMMTAAEEACYSAKDLGRNRVYVFHESDTELARRHGEMLWISRIHQALSEDRFELVYQRIVPVREAASDGLRMELLVRMLDDDGRHILPGAFLPAAERYNLATQIDAWVIRAALGWMSERQDMLEHLDLCCINLSGHSLGAREILDYLGGELRKGRVPGDKLCFEITETATIANLNTALQFMNRLREFGCHFALDDFGSGLSSFNYLRMIPADYLKIDGSFVRDITKDSVLLEMTKSINDIGHVMGKKTIAEFVENDDILAKLREIGVDYAQGYGIARPAPLEELNSG